MRQLVRNLFSWLHTTAVSYDYESIESIESCLVDDTRLSTPQKLCPPPLTSLPTLKWSTPNVIQRLKQRPPPILQTIKQHSSPILHTIEQHPLCILQRIKIHPSWKAFAKPSTNSTTSGAPSSKLESLPNELKLAIMQRLPNFDPLRELALTSKSFHQFRSHHNHAIAPFVLETELGLPLFQEAYWVSKAAQADLSHADYPRKLTVFFNELACCEPSSIEPRTVSLKTTTDISTLHRKVTFLVKDLCSWAMEDSLPLGHSKSSRSSLSENETRRIAQAFYRLELFCILFRHSYLGTVGDAAEQRYEAVRAQAYTLFGYWNAWGNEEIACVRDYIQARLAVVFACIEQAASVKPFNIILYDPWDEVPEVFPSGTVYLASDLIPDWFREDSNCGADLSPQGRDLGRFQGMFLLQGLDCLTRLFSSDNPQEQADIFMSKWADFTHNPDDFGGFSAELESTPLRMRQESGTREAFFHGDEEVFESDENAEGPNFAWAWAGEQKFHPYYASADRARLRRWGYVMCDHKRLMESHACKNSPNLRDAFWRCEQSLVEAHEQTCWRRATGMNHEDEDGGESYIVDEEGQLSSAEVDGDGIGFGDESLVDEGRAQETEKDNDSNEEQLAGVRTTSSDSGYASVTPSTLHPEAIKQSQIAHNDLAEEAEGPQDAQATVTMPLDAAIQAALQEEHSFSPTLPEEATTYPESFSNVDAIIDSPSHDKPAMEAAVEPEYIFKPPLARKIARAISPQAKMLKAQQDAVQTDEVFSSDWTNVEGQITIECTTPGSTVIQVRSPSPPASDCSSTSSGSINWIISPPSSKTSNERSPSPTRAADCVTTPPQHSTKKGRKLQNRGAKQSTSSKGTDQETEIEDDSYTKLAEASTWPAPYALDPSEVAAWIKTTRSRHSSSPSESGKVNAESSGPTKQQRKKANRKARKATMEMAIKHAQETEAERVKVEEAKKEHQKMKKERKKLEKAVGGEKAKGKRKSPAGKEEARKNGKGKKERKTGYLIG